MVIKLALIAAISIVFITADGWKGIVPLQTTRSQAEQILGSPIEACDNQCNYKSGDDRVFVRYSGGPCTQNNPLRIPAGTVVQLSVYPGKAPRIADLRFDRRTFKKTKDPELNGYYWYENEEQGVTYSVSNRGQVTGINWIGSSEDNKKLRCPTL